jgi:hypothetical protein
MWMGKSRTDQGEHGKFETEHYELMKKYRKIANDNSSNE